MSMIQTLSAPIGRALLSVMFIMSGYGKIGGYEGTQGYMEAMGVPGMLLPLVIIVELIGGIAVLVGFQTRIAATLLAGFCVLTAVIFHYQPDDMMQMIIFNKNLAIAGGFILLVAHGAGAYSLDNRGK